MSINIKPRKWWAQIVKHRKSTKNKWALNPKLPWVVTPPSRWEKRRSEVSHDGEPRTVHRTVLPVEGRFPLPYVDLFDFMWPHSSHLLSLHFTLLHFVWYFLTWTSLKCLIVSHSFSVCIELVLSSFFWSNACFILSQFASSCLRC